MGTGGGPANPGRIRVRTITITAPQQSHRMGARCLTHAIAWPGANFRSRCSKAIRRLQLGCRKPKLRARLESLGQHMLQHQPEELRAGKRSALQLSGTGVAITEADFAVGAGEDVFLGDDARYR